MKPVYLSLGSNMGDRERYIRTAIEKLESPTMHVLRVSPVYETAPLELTAQRWFLNLALEAETGMFPLQLLAWVQKIERALGRLRTVPNGPRIIDIDILLYGSAQIHTDSLEIPHPRMCQRRFVLAPLADLVPDLRHPSALQTIQQLLEAAPQQKIAEYAG